MLLAVPFLVTCRRDKPFGEGVKGDPTDSLPAQFKTQEEVAKPDFATQASSPAFQQAIQDAASLLGASPLPLHSEPEGEEVHGCVSFDVSQEKAVVQLRKAHADFLARGFYLFRYQWSFGGKGCPDKIGLLPTTDKYAVIAAMGTNGDNYGIGTAGVIAWMKELEQEHPFVLTGIGFDTLEGFFTAPVANPDSLAKLMYQFCPDIVDQGTETLGALASELRKGNLYFWWD